MAAITAAIAFALDSYAASYAKEAIESQPLVKVKRSLGRPKGSSKAAKAQTEKSEVVPSSNGRMLPKGNLTAIEFVTQLRRATDLNAKIQIIAGYNGYDFSKPYGTQEWFALAKARQEVKPVNPAVLSREEQRQQSARVPGWVAGMPETRVRFMQDLEARERLSVEKRNEHVRIARKGKNLSWEERRLNIGLARLESERLVSIRADIAQYM